MKAVKYVPIFIGILLAMFFGISLIYRIALPYDSVFVGEWVKYTSIDAYYQMRIVDNIVSNFPNVTAFDPYLLYPSTGGYGDIHFFNWFLAGITWIIGMGSPTAHTVDVVGVVFPTILAALIVIPTYFIGKMLFNRWVGVLAAALVAVLPGEFLGRSFLGFTDTHIMEALLTTTFLAFFIGALKTASERQLSFSHIRHPDRKVIVRPLVLSLLAGIVLGLYLITWLGGMLFVFIITVYLLFQFVINHLKGKSSDHLSICSFALFVPALIIFLPFSNFRDMSIAMAGITVLPLVLGGLSRLIANRNWKPLYYPLSIVGLAVIVIGAIQLFDSVLISNALFKFKMVFVPGGPTAATTTEIQPFIGLEKGFPTAIAWFTYTTGFFLVSPELLFNDSSWIASLKWFPGFAFIPIFAAVWMFRKYKKSLAKNIPLTTVIGIVLLGLTIWLWFIAPADWKFWFPGFGVIAFLILIWQFVKQRGEDQGLLLLFIWTIIIMIATLVQRRFNYYLTINIALLCGYFSYLVIWLAGLRKLDNKNKETGSEQTEGAGAKKQQKKQAQPVLPMYRIYIIVAICAVFVFVFSFNIVKAKETAEDPQYEPSDAWQESLLWLKDNTPEPLGDADAYYSLFEQPAEGEEFYTEDTYAVASWWDYGYWITRTGHRIPTCNPSQAAAPIKKTAAMLLENDIGLFYEKTEELNASYVMIDYPLTRLNLKMHAILTWAAQDWTDLVETYYIRTEDKLIPMTFYYPEYYQTAIVRLFNFDGKEVNNIEPIVIVYDTIKDESTGNSYKIVKNISRFTRYEDALEYMESQDTTNCRIVSSNRFVSPIPLEPLDNYRLAYSSSQTVSSGETEIRLEEESAIFDTVSVETPEVKIFEYIE